MRDVICDKNEFAIIANKIENYSDFLIRCISEYLSILEDIQLNSIKDEVVRKGLGDISEKIKPLASTIDVYGNGTAKILRNDVKDLENIDNFKFPKGMDSSIALLISMFS